MRIVGHGDLKFVLRSEDPFVSATLKDVKDPSLQKLPRRLVDDADFMPAAIRAVRELCRRSAGQLFNTERLQKDMSARVVVSQRSKERTAQKDALGNAQLRRL